MEEIKEVVWDDYPVDFETHFRAGLANAEQCKRLFEKEKIVEIADQVLQDFYSKTSLSSSPASSSV